MLLSTLNDSHNEFQKLKLADLERQICAARSANEEKEKKRKAFFKRQQKFYCQNVWGDLVQENKNQLQKEPKEG